MLWHVVDRLRRVEGLRDVVVATTDRPEDDALRAFCRERTIRCFSGSENDVLDRYYRAAQLFGADPIVRVTADCPLIDSGVVGQALELCRRRAGEVVYIGFDPSYPDGLDVEVIALGALEQAWREAKLASEREHVTPFIWKQADRFPQDRMRHHEDLSAQRWTVDRPEDYQLVQRIYHALYQPGHPFGMDEVLAFLREHPELQRLNAGITRNEGYLKSVREDHALTGKKS